MGKPRYLKVFGSVLFCILYCSHFYTIAFVNSTLFQFRCLIYKTLHTKTNDWAMRTPHKAGEGWTQMLSKGRQFLLHYYLVIYLYKPVWMIDYLNWLSWRVEYVGLNLYLFISIEQKESYLYSDILQFGSTKLA